MNSTERSSSISPIAGRASGDWPCLVETRRELVDTFLGTLTALLPVMVGVNLLRARSGPWPPHLVLQPLMLGVLLLLYLGRRRLQHRLKGHILLGLFTLYWVQVTFELGNGVPASAMFALIVPIAAALLLGARAGWSYLGLITSVLILGAGLDAWGILPPWPSADFSPGPQRIAGYWLIKILGVPIFGSAFLFMLARLFQAWVGLAAGLEAEVAERRAAQIRLAASEAHLRAAFAQSAVGFARLGLDGRILEANQPIAAVLGCSIQDLCGRHFLEVTVAEDREVSLRAMEALIAGEVSTYTLEKRYQRPNGPVVFGRLTASMIRDAQGRAENIFVVLEDITGHRRAEEERQRLQDQLIHSQKMESIGRLAGGVAHDLNNMLTATLGHAEILKGQLAPDSPLLTQLAGIEQASWRSSGIVRQLLTFSRQQVVQPVLVDLNARLAETRTVLAPLIGAAVRLTFRPGDGLWRVRMDPLQLDQVLMNLTLNARDAMPDGGQVVLETRNIVITEADCRRHPFMLPGPHVMFTVSDDGTGMDRATQARVFEPFFTTKAPGKGTGLGLATVFGIIKQAGGFVDLYSEPGMGTTFKIYLPGLTLDGERPPVSEPRQLPWAAGHRTVLVVEDDAILQDVLPAMLKELGYAAILARSPEEALTLCAQPDTALDVLLTDVGLPGMSVQALRERIAALRPDLGVVFMSGHSLDLVGRQGVTDLGPGLLQKPFTSYDLARKLAGALQQVDPVPGERRG